MLVIACVFMGIWVRSQFVHDSSIPGSGHGYEMHQLRILRGGMLVFRVSMPTLSSGRRRELNWRPVWWQTLYEPSATNDPTEYVTKDNGIQWRWRCIGFDIGQLGRPVPRSPFVYWWLVPHWFFAIPSTLLSAYLLLSKPRSKTLYSTVSPDHM